MSKLLIGSVQRASNKNAGMVAAGISYYAFLALVPLLAATLLIYGLVVSPATVSAQVASLSQNLPSSTAQLIGDQLTQISQSQAGSKGVGLVVALAIALFGARNAAGSIMEGLNMVENRTETRGFFKRFGIALGITIGGIFALGLLAVVIGLASSLPGFIGLIAGLGVVLIAGAIGAAFLYRRAPDITREELGTVWPGAVLFAVGWVVLTGAFSLYVKNFANYNATYGSLGAIIILLTWFYLSAWLLILGAEFNALFHGKGRQEDDATAIE